MYVPVLHSVLNKTINTGRILAIAFQFSIFFQNVTISPLFYYYGQMKILYKFRPVSEKSIHTATTILDQIM